VDLGLVAGKLVFRMLAGLVKCEREKLAPRVKVQVAKWERSLQPSEKTGRLCEASANETQQILSQTTQPHQKPQEDVLPQSWASDHWRKRLPYSPLTSGGRHYPRVA